MKKKKRTAWMMGQGNLEGWQIPSLKGEGVKE